MVRSCSCIGKVRFLSRPFLHGRARSPGGIFDSWLSSVSMNLIWSRKNAASLRQRFRFWDIVLGTNRLQERKVKAILEWPTPTKIKETSTPPFDKLSNYDVLSILTSIPTLSSQRCHPFTHKHRSLGGGSTPSNLPIGHIRGFSLHLLKMLWPRLP